MSRVLLTQLVQSSRRLGRRRDLCLWGGGNTSVKQEGRGKEKTILYVKGTGVDLKKCRKRDFVGLDLEKLLKAKSLQLPNGKTRIYLNGSKIDPKSPEPSIESFLHAFLPFEVIHHTHPEAVLSVTNQKEGRKLARMIFGRRLLWVPYARPGIALAGRVLGIFKKHPGAEGAILEKHGLVTWGSTAGESLARTFEFVKKAEDFLRKLKADGTSAAGNKRTLPVLPAKARKEWLRQFLSFLTRLPGIKPACFVHSSTAVVGRYLARRDLKTLAEEGPPTPDHQLKTGRVPLVAEAPRGAGYPFDKNYFDTLIRRYAGNYRRLYKRYLSKTPENLDVLPRVYLIPGVGLVARGSTKREARMVVDLYTGSMIVQMNASLSSPYRSYSLGEQFEIENWRRS